MSFTIDYGVSVITREEWGARGPRSRSYISGSYGSTCHWEGPSLVWPRHHNTCYSYMRGIQNYHMDANGWQDIAYSSIICPHGFIFQCRWLGVRSAANGTNEGNSTAFAHCYLGGVNNPFTPEGRKAMRAVLDYFDRNGAGSGRNCHRDWKNTQCPGDEVCGWVHSDQQLPEDDDMNVDEFNALLTTPGSVARTAFRELAAMGARDAQPAPYYFVVPSSNSNVTYVVAADGQSKLRLERGSETHVFFKNLLELGGHDGEPTIIAQATLDPIPDAV